MVPVEAVRTKQVHVRLSDIEAAMLEQIAAYWKTDAIDAIRQLVRREALRLERQANRNAKIETEEEE